MACKSIGINPWPINVFKNVEKELVGLRMEVGQERRKFQAPWGPIRV
jgi:hypothetical protein